MKRMSTMPSAGKQQNCHFGLCDRKICQEENFINSLSGVNADSKGTIFFNREIQKSGEHSNKERATYNNIGDEQQ